MNPIAMSILVDATDALSTAYSHRLARGEADDSQVHRIV
jgi:hypothetical protein